MAKTATKVRKKVKRTLLRALPTFMHRLITPLSLSPIVKEMRFLGQLLVAPASAVRASQRRLLRRLRQRLLVRQLRNAA